MSTWEDFPWQMRPQQNVENAAAWSERRRQELQIECDSLAKDFHDLQIRYDELFDTAAKYRDALCGIAMGRTYEDVDAGSGLCTDTITAARLCGIARDALR